MLSLELDRNSYAPLYVQLAEALKDAIKTGKLPYGAKLPSENEIVSSLHVSRMTVRSAIAILYNEHYITKQQGRGTFVCYVPGLCCGTIDVLLDVQDAAFSHRYIYGISDVLKAADLNFNFHDTANSQTEIASQLQRIMNTGSAGVILQPSNKNEPASAEMKTVLQQLTERGIPYILIDHDVEDLPGARVIVDDHEGGRIAAEYLIGLGHRNLAMYCCESFLENRQRLLGFRSAADDHALPAVTVFSHGKITPASLAETIKRKRITGIFCFADQNALSVIQYLNDAHLSVPGDVSVIGYDDTAIASVMNPPLTSIAHPKAGLASKAAALLVECIQSGTRPARQILMTPKIILRSSCRPNG